MSEYLNLQPGTTVPKTGKYKCEFCGAGGIADIMGDLLGQNGVGFDGSGLNAHGQTGTTGVFHAGEIFPQCPKCGDATGWSLVEEI